MATEVKLPELGDGIESGEVLDVFVKEGDTVTKDQPICEMETDKAMVEVPSSTAGTIVKVHIGQGDQVPIGGTLITVEGGSEASGATAAAPEPAPEPTPEPAAPAEPAAPEPVIEEAQPAAAPAPPIAPAPAEPVAAAQPAAAPASSSTAAAPASPTIRRLAREVGIDLEAIEGTGEGGRITRQDVLLAVRQASAAPPAAPAAASETPKTDPTSARPASKQPSSPDESATSDNWGPIRVERMTKIRRTIATKMHESWSTAPRVTNFDDADVTELERIRQASKQDYKSRGIKLTSMPFVIKAVALALRQNPEVNAAIDEAGEQIIYKQYVNVGIAVDTPRGLVVPSLRQPDELGIADIARSLGVIADNARESNFKIDDLRGSTFTISNLGAIGGTYSTPIINVPEVAILLLGRSRKLPVVMPDDTIEARLMMPLSLSYDHRLVDGAAAARFLNDVIAFLENPSRLLIAP